MVARKNVYVFAKTVPGPHDVILIFEKMFSPRSLQGQKVNVPCKNCPIFKIYYITNKNKYMYIFFYYIFLEHKDLFEIGQPID